MRSLERCLVLHNERGFGYAVTVNYTTRFCYVHLEYVSPLFYVLESVSSFIDSFVFFFEVTMNLIVRKRKRVADMDLSSVLLSRRNVESAKRNKYVAARKGMVEAVAVAEVSHIA